MPPPVNTFYCCNCGDGPFIVDLYAACIRCDHRISATCCIVDGIGQGMAADYTRPLQTKDISNPGPRMDDPVNEASTPEAQSLHPLGSEANDCSQDFESDSYEEMLVDHASESNERSTHTLDLKFFDTEDDVMLDSFMASMSTTHNLDELMAELSECLMLECNGKLHNDFESFLLYSFHSLEQARKGLASLIRAINILEREKLCSESFSLLVADPGRVGVVAAISISKQDIKELESHVSMYEEDFNDEHGWRVIKKLQSALSPLTIVSQEEEIHKSSIEFVWNLLLDVCGTAFSILRLSLISFSKSHLSDFNELFQDSTENLNVIHVSKLISFQKIRLNCLQQFVGGPVWAFGQNGLERCTYHVSIDLNTFADLWGPVWAISETSEPLGFQEIFTEDGIIVPLPAKSSPRALPTEISCHWKPSTSLEIRTRMKGPSHTPDSIHAQYPLGSLKMLIGAGEQVPEQSRTYTQPSTSERVIRTKELPEFIRNGKCPMSHILVCTKRTLKVPGTYGSTYEPDSYTVNFASGYKFTFGATKGWKRKPERPLKTTLLAMLNGMKGKIIPILKANVGLEISRCSINARRITLWDALTMAHVGKKVHTNNITAPISDPCNHSVGQIACIAECWNLAGALSRVGVHFTDDMLIDVAPGDSSEISESKSKVRELVLDAIAELEETGVDQEGVLQAFYPYAEAPTVVCLNLESKETKESNNWISMVKDSPYTACFAVISDSCLVSPLTGSSLNPNYGRCLMDPYFSDKKRRSLFQTTFYRCKIGTADMKLLQGGEQSVPKGIPIGKDLFIDKVGTLKPVNQSGLVLELHCNMWNRIMKGRVE